jgi:HPt (histidine-containing phosphotransfer) domain-containing protein
VSGRPVSDLGIDESVLASLRALDDDDDPDFYGRVLRKFLVQADQVLGDLRRALAAHDTAAIARAAHGWKGSSGQLGLRHDYDACVEAEIAAKRGDVPAAGGAVAAAEEAFARARARLEREASPKA